MKCSVFTFAIAAALALPVLAVDSTIDLTPGKTAALPPPDPGSVVREGTHYINRTGRLTRSANGMQSTLTFDPDGSTARIPPMIVLQNLNLFSMESAQPTHGPALDFRVSGTVTEYKGRNYILLDKAQTTLNAVAPAPVSTPAPSAKLVAKPTVEPMPVMQPKSSTSAAPSATPDETMSRLLSPPPAAGQPLPSPAFNDAPAVDRTSGPAAIAPAAPSVNVIREGTHLINRVGRLSHTPDGQQAIFTFDADAKAMKDPPIIVLPNLKLQTMEQSNFNLSKDQHFRVSGTITEYKGRNYIELDKAVMMADVEVQF